jgi:hypothetical protein
MFGLEIAQWALGEVEAELQPAATIELHVPQYSDHQFGHGVLEQCISSPLKPIIAVGRFDMEGGQKQIADTQKDKWVSRCAMCQQKSDHR